MPLILNLPLELLTEVLRQIDAISDLTAVRLSCKRIYQISRGKIWRTIQDSVFANETSNNITRELVALLRVRELKLRKPLDQLLVVRPPSPLPFEPEFCPDLQELTNLQRVLHWFTNRFLRYHLKSLPEENIPSSTEISRVNDAFCVLWLLMEASYKPSRRDGPDIMNLVKLALNTNYRSVGPNTGILYLVYEFLKSEIVAISEFYLLNADSAYLEEISYYTGCLTQYTRLGLPNLILTSLGLDDLKQFLEGSHDQQQTQVGTYFSGAIRYGENDPFNTFELFELFAKLIDTHWGCGPKNFELSTKPLWLASGYIYYVIDPPWCQPQGFQINKIFWDDERLWRWGYQPPTEVSFKAQAECRPIRGLPIFFVCKNCPSSWWCIFRETEFLEDDPLGP